MATAAPVEPNHRDASPAFRTTVELIDRFASYTGRPIAWLIIPMTIAVTWEVVARHFFRAPTIWAFDVVYMLYGTHFMLGTAYTLMRIGHVRTDMLYSRWSIRRQNRIDAIGYFFFFFPAMIFLFYFGWQEAYHCVPDRGDLGREPLAADRVAVQVRHPAHRAPPAHPGYRGAPQEPLRHSNGPRVGPS